MSDMVRVKSPLHELTPEAISRLARENKTKFSVVFNTDVSSGNGQHWFCVFIEMAS